MANSKLIKSKWVDSAEPDALVSAVAALALQDRLRVVEHYVPLAAREADDDVEYVHQLRVSTRRAVSALQVFRDLLPKKRTKQVKKQLNALRQASGDARDLDVLHERLRRQAKQDGATELKSVIKDVVRRREAAQEPLLQIYKTFRKQDFTSAIASVLDRIRWRQDGDEPSFSDAARPALRKAVDKLLDAASADLSSAENLHQMRIAGKRLRYAMELLATAFPPSFKKELYPVFGEVQGKLGAINDHATAASTFEAWADASNDSPSAYRELADEEARLTVTEGDEFRAWWTAKRAADLRRQFEVVLSGSADTSSSDTEDVLPAETVMPTETTVPGDNR
jgi:CHAD domain-containing protein